MYDILLKNAYLVDSSKSVYGDLAIKDGKIEKIDENIDVGSARDVIDLKDKLTIPGVIDPHVHLASRYGGDFGHKMLALTGVTTAFDFSGPVESVWEIAKRSGRGLNVCSLNSIRPGVTVDSKDPSEEELEKFLIQSLEAGALGYKLLGGHYPLTEEATKKAIALSNKHGAYVGFHAGSDSKGSNLEGMRQAIELAGSNPLHLAHINSYCRGQVEPIIDESLEAIELLKNNRNIISESYLSSYNGTNARYIDGLPESHVTRKCLEIGGYGIEQAELEKALNDGYANYSIEYGGINKLITGPEAVEAWKANDRLGTLSFAVNPALSRYLLASEKRDDGEFVVDAFSSDGGGIPRNEIIDKGLNLVKWGAITLNEFVKKSSFNPSRMLGLLNKGKLEEGYDADIVVVDYETNKPIVSIASGKVIMYDGYVIGKGTTAITTERGAKRVEEYGLDSYIVDLNDSLLYSKK